MNGTIARLTRLCDGRPISWTDGRLSIEHEYSKKGVNVYLDAGDLALSDDDLVSRFIAPALLALEMEVYPDRLTRKMAAMKAELESAQ